MEQVKEQFDFQALGLAIKNAREQRGWTQKYLGELIGRTGHTVMCIENRGQYPRFNTLIQLVTMFDISLDQFVHTNRGDQADKSRKHLDILLNSMSEHELMVMEATAEGLKKAREAELSG